jgi:hypothetical protein
MKIVELQTSEIAPLPFNPPTRVEEDGLKELLASIEKRGIIQPLVVTPNKQLIDGHRRLKCAEMLGIKTVWGNIVDAEDIADLYVELNNAAKTIAPKDWLVIHLMGGVIPRRNLTTINALKRAVGDAGLQKLALRRMSTSIYGIATMVATYCDVRDQLGAIVMWLIDCGQFNVRAAMKSLTPPDVIMQAVKANKPLVFTAGA